MAKGSVRKRHSGGCAVREGGRCNCKALWSVRFPGPDERRRERGGYSTQAAAQAALRGLMVHVDHGTFRDPKRMGFADFAERWRGARAAQVKPATAAMHEWAIRVHLVPFFGPYDDLRKISQEHVEIFVAWKTAHRRHARRCPDACQGRPCTCAGASCTCPPEWSPKTIANILGVLKTALGTAVEWGYLAANPAERVRPPARAPVERDFLSVDELRDVIDAAGQPWGTIILAAGCTGLRRGELLGLRWADVELDRGRLLVRRSFGRYGFGSPKTSAGTGRAVPLTPSLLAALRAHRRELLGRGLAGDELVFPSRDGGPIDPDNLKRAWLRALRRAGVRSVPFHALRHTAASLLVAHERLNPKQLQAVMGHAGIGMTLDLYGHLLPDSFDGFGEGLDGLDLGQRGHERGHGALGGAIG